MDMEPTDLVPDPQTQMGAFGRFPPELLIEIFGVCCTEQSSILSSNAVCISHVCALWRSLALSSPLLWTSFSLGPKKLSKQGFSAVAEEVITRLLRLHLERSQSCLLSFEADFSITSSSMHADAVALNLLSLLVCHSQRWERVKLAISPALEPVYSTLRGRLPHLTSLEFYPFGFTAYQSSEPDFLETAPKLERLVIGNYLPQDVPVPLHQLTELHLGAAVTWDLMYFLSRGCSPRLRTLVLNPYHPAKKPYQVAQVPVFPELRRLVLVMRGFSRNPIVEVLNLLTAPSLTTLEFVCRREFQIPTSAIAAFLERSSTRLAELHITFKAKILVPQLLRTLCTLPSVTQFVIVAWGLEAFQCVEGILLGLHQSAVSILPNLRMLEIQAAAQPTSLLDLVRSRMHPIDGCAALEQLVLHDVPFQADALEGQGLTIFRLPRLKPSESFRGIP
ncbi:unnamed protein product [Mycena citricolor]|uniref:F-box domain-containing protein n=1 Tax=Mycena citricolor TaxID=2018698 RepID=A0AAD2HKH2_9AGAR|nr:unnamed protein product [Mycena citricolor]